MNEEAKALGDIYRNLFQYWHNHISFRQAFPNPLELVKLHPVEADFLHEFYLVNKPEEAVAQAVALHYELYYPSSEG